MDPDASLYRPGSDPLASDTSFSPLTTPPPLAAEGVKCVLHRYHWPRPLRCELHHVIPRAWQLFWAPEGKLGLWAPRTTPLCPTGHRNLHIRMVALMRHAKELGTDDPLEVWTSARLRGRGAKLAGEALTDFAAAGGSLQALVAANQLGWG